MNSLLKLLLIYFILSIMVYLTMLQFSEIEIYSQKSVDTFCTKTTYLIDLYYLR